MRAHTGAARRPPVARSMIGRCWSNPIQTAVSMLRRVAHEPGVGAALVVPVFPAAGARKPARRTAEPVPRDSASRSASVTM